MKKLALAVVCFSLTLGVATYAAKTAAPAVAKPVTATVAKTAAPAVSKAVTPTVSKTVAPTIAKPATKNDPIKFVDVPDDHYANSAVYRLVSRGVTKGYPDLTFRGEKTLSRYELAAYLANYDMYVQKVVVQPQDLRDLKIRLLEQETQQLRELVASLNAAVRSFRR